MILNNKDKIKIVLQKNNKQLVSEMVDQNYASTLLGLDKIIFNKSYNIVDKYADLENKCIVIKVKSNKIPSRRKNKSKANKRQIKKLK